MLENVIIKNFQAHKKLVLDTDHPITTITGPSDVGKSAILRAIWWAMTNTPGGTGFIRQGAAETAVDITIDGRTITRTRGKSKNEYSVDDGPTMVSFGSGVPDDISTFLNVGPENFQQQHDAPYWFAESAGAVSRRINELVDLSAIDAALTNVNGRITGTRQKAEATKISMDAAVEARNAAAWAIAANGDLAALENDQAQIDTLQTNLAELSTMVVGIRACTTEIDALTKLLDAAVVLMDLADRIRDDGKEKQAAQSILAAMRQDQRVVDGWIDVDFSESDGLIAEIRTTSDEIKTTRAAVGQAREAARGVVEAQTQISTAEADFAQVSQGVCPLCGK